MSNYTKGPWRYMRSVDRYSNSLRIFAESTYLGIITNSDMQSGEIEANARLVAAAPDLLVALKGMVDRFSAPYTLQKDQPKTFSCNHAADTCQNCDGMVTAWKAVQTAISAIEKANGSNDEQH